MPSYSSTQLHKDWRYAVREEFTKGDGEPFPYAEKGRQRWGNEIKKIPFDQEPHDGCVSKDGSRLAIAVQNNIHIIDTRAWDIVTILKGHITRVSALAFNPKDANILVSSDQQNYGWNDPKANPVIIVWDIEKNKADERTALKSGSVETITETAVQSAVEELSTLGVSVDDGTLQSLRESFSPAISRVALKHAVKDNVLLHGRLCTSFQSEIFSPSGRWVIFLPGDRPRSNDTDVWDAVVYTTEKSEHQMTLTGHTDNIMWTGWSPDEAFIATASWDRTVRIWDASTGQQRYCFDTGLQNWTAAFSPDSRYFATTDGKGYLRIYNLVSDSPTEPYWQYLPETGELRRGSLAWHPNGKILAMGGRSFGELLLLDVEKKGVIQRRLLSPEKITNVEIERFSRIMKHSVGVSEVVFGDCGDKLAFWTYGDSSIEVYDLVREVKWRFARGGTEPDDDSWKNVETGEVTSKGGHGMLVWEGSPGEGVALASIDYDGVRIWSLLSEQGRRKTSEAC